MYELVIDTKSISIDKKYWYCDKRFQEQRFRAKVKEEGAEDAKY